MSSRPLARGDLLGRYVVLERLGVGGMGEVFAAYDPQLDRKIAVKLLLPTSASAGANRLLREAQAMAKLRHPNVVTVHDVGTHGDRVFVAMEFVEGGTLADWMSAGSDGRGAPHPWREVLERFDAAGRGLAAAHAAKLVHRDFKPANVLLGRDGQVRVADFGLVRRTLDEPESTPTVDEPRDAIRETAQPTDGEDPDATLAPERPELDDAAEVSVDDATLAAPSLPSSLGSSDSLSQRMTQTGATLGTPAYMAPEQYAGRDVDARADQFSFCVALWEALHGRRPFAGDNLHALMFAIERGQIREPDDDRGVPTAIRRAITRGLARDPAARWPDLDGLLDALRVDPEQARRRRRGIALGLTFAGVALVAYTQREAPQPEPEPPPPCSGAAEALGDALAPARRDALARHFGAFEHAWARDMGERLLPRLDAWAEAWQRGWTDACEDTRVRGEQSEELLDRRMVCLDRKRRRFVELVDALTLADEALAKKADVAIDELGALDTCADEEALLRVTPLPDDAAKVDTILRIEHDLAAAERLYLASEYAEAYALLEPHRGEVTTLAYPPLVAAFEQIDGRLRFELDDPLAGEQALERAFVTALAAGDDPLAIEIACSLATAVNDLERPKDALRWLDIAKGLATRSEDDDGLARIALTRSQSLGQLGEYPAAEAAAREAYDRYVADDPTSRRVGDALYLLGMSDYRAGRLDETIVHVDRAREIWAQSIGPTHPRNTSALGLLGVAARGLGKYEVAQGYFEQVLAIKLATYGSENRDVASARMNLAVVLGDQGKHDEAIAQLEQVVALRRRLPEAAESELGRALINLGQLHRAMGRLDEADASLSEGVELVRGELGDDHPDLVTAYHFRAELDLARGQLDSAKRAASAAVRIAELKLPGNPQLVEVYTVAAKVALADADAREAKRLLDLTFGIELADPVVRVRRDDVLARTLVELGQLEEGLSLARTTKTTLQELGPKVAPELAALERWLAERE